MSKPSTDVRKSRMMVAATAAALAFTPAAALADEAAPGQTPGLEIVSEQGEADAVRDVDVVAPVADTGVAAEEATVADQTDVAEPESLSEGEDAAEEAQPVAVEDATDAMPVAKDAKTAEQTVQEDAKLGNETTTTPVETSPSAAMPSEDEDGLPAQEDERERAAKDEGDDVPTQDELEPEQVEDEADDPVSAQAAADLSHISYEAHVQNIGWQAAVSDGQLSGTAGQGLRMEGMRLHLVDTDGNDMSGLSYKAHVQNLGWMDWVSDGALVGTTGRGLRIEAIKIKLNDELSQMYDVVYRSHVQNYGWLDWTGNGEATGSSGQGLRVEAIEVALRKKNEDGTSSFTKGARTFIDGAAVSLSAHVQNIGWIAPTNGVAGTTGRGLRMEAVTAKLSNVDYEGGITYQAHVQNIGWQDAVTSGMVAGTSGKGYRVEAFNFALTGEVAEHYDVYYRAHVQDYGWLGWASNGNDMGTEGLGKRMESIQVRLVPKGGPAPSSSGSAFDAAFVASTPVVYDSADEGTWQGMVRSGVTSGSTDGALIDRVRAQLDIREGSMAGGINYQARAKNGTWGPVQTSWNAVGTDGTDIDALRFTLTGELGKAFDVYYRTHIPEKGWLAWTKNGDVSGTGDGTNTGIDAYRVMLVAKGNSAPQNDDVDYKFLETYYAPQSQRDNTVTKYLGWAVDIAQDDSHGYSQINRWGPDYDCSSLVLTALRQAGLKVGEATYTGNFLDYLPSLGWSVNEFRSQSQLKRGDILLNVIHHTEFYIGGGLSLAARESENHDIDGKTGDQTGWEITIKDYSNYGDLGWDYFLRLK